MKAVARTKKDGSAAPRSALLQRPAAPKSASKSRPPTGQLSGKVVPPGALNAIDVDAIRRWATQLGYDLVKASPLPEDFQLIAVDAFARAVGVVPTDAGRLIPSVLADSVAATREALSEVADDGVLGPEEVDLALPSVWGPPVTEEQREKAESANLRRAFQARESVVAHSMSRADTAALLGLSEQAVTKKLDRGQMIGIKVKGQWAIPSWQLDPDSQEGILPGLTDLKAAFPGGPVALSRWVVKPSPDLAGRAPRDAMASNRVGDVVRTAAALSATGW